MIFDAILDLFYNLLAPILDALPDVSLPGGVLDTFGSVQLILQQFNGWLPFLPVLSFWFHVISITFVPLLTYRIGLWIYNRVRG